VVGNGYGSGGDGGAASDASLIFPTGVAFDGAANFYIADTGNHRIRKVTPSGIINTIAGTGTPGFNGDGGAAKNAQLNAPGGLAVDARGNLYFADQLNHRVRLITSDQVFLILFGTGLRNRSALSTVVAQIGGVNAEILFTGAQGDFVGLDQVNLRLPRNLAGRGEVDIVLTAEDKAANIVRVNIK
jgi:uncharacterized protein (TIGR03437 family)